MTNPYASPPACPKCKDSRITTRSQRAAKTDLVPCDRCGLLNEDEYQRFRRDAWIKAQAPPSICELDLSTDELATYRQLRALNPHASKTTVLSWMEGQRYRPENDQDFLVAAREEFRKWRAR